MEEISVNTRWGKPRYVRLQEDEFRAVDEIAKRQGLSFAAYVRVLIARELARRAKIAQKTSVEIEAQLAEN